jgi:hypothetical protein
MHTGGNQSTVLHCTVLYCTVLYCISVILNLLRDIVTSTAQDFNKFQLNVVLGLPFGVVFTLQLLIIISLC